MDILRATIHVNFVKHIALFSILLTLLLCIEVRVLQAFHLDVEQGQFYKFALRLDPGSNIVPFKGSFDRELNLKQIRSA